MTSPAFFATAPRIRLRDPLAAFLGAAEDGIFEYAYADVVKLAGHSCPTVASAYLITRAALARLYPDTLPERGAIRVELREGRLEGTTGVVANVASYLTGAIIRADGGTRTASVTGGFVALAMACRWMLDRGMAARMPLSDFVAAVSVGILDGEALLDLCYEEDAAAEVDMNVVMTGSGRFVEIQATGEESTFSERQHGHLIRLAKEGIRTLTELQRKSLGDAADLIGGGR